MAIARIWQTGWEFGTSNLEATVNGSMSASGGKSGPRRTVFGSTDGTYIAHSASISQARAACHFTHVSGGGFRAILSFESTTTDIIQVAVNVMTGAVRAICGTTVVATGSAPQVVKNNFYCHVAADVKVHATTGWVYIYIDGRQVIAYNGKTDHGGATFNRLYLGAAVVADGGSLSNNAFVDDVYWDDTTGEATPAQPPDLRFQLISPNGNGNYSQWVGSDGNSVNNSLLNDEIPHTTETDYVTTATSGNKDSYAMSTFTLPPNWTIPALIPAAVLRKTDAAGSTGIKLGTRYSATDVVGAKQSLTTTYAFYRERQTTKPGGGAWDQTSLDGVELLLEAAL